MTITFLPLSSTHETAAGTHVRRMRSSGATAPTTAVYRTAAGVHRRRMHALGLPAGANGSVGIHPRRTSHAGVALGGSYEATHQTATGLHRRRLRMLGTAIGGALDIDPEIPALGVHGREIQATGVAYANTFVECDHSRKIGTFGWATGSHGATNDAAGVHRRRTGAVGWDSGDTEAGHGLLVAQPFFISGYGGQWFENLRDTIDVSSPASSLPTAVLREALLVMLEAVPTASTSARVTERVVARSALHAVLHSAIAEVLVLEAASSESPQMVARLVERVLLSGTVRSLAEAATAVTELLVLRGLLDAYLLETVSEGLLAAAAVADRYAAAAAVVEQALLSVTADSEMTVTVLVREQALVAPGAATEADVAALIRENIGLVASLTLDNGHYVAWLLNTESSGLSTYTNYPFNSFAQVGGRYLGMTSEGLFDLEGDDDDGEPIAAKLRLGMQALGTRKIKRIPEAYIGYTGDGRLILRVIFVRDGTGEKVAAEYRMKPRPAGSTRESRFEPGKGVQAVDFDFEIENIDGGDFDLTSVEFHPLVLDRRTRG